MLIFKVLLVAAVNVIKPGSLYYGFKDGITLCIYLQGNTEEY